MFIAACVKKGVQPCKGGMFICVVAKTLLKITKLTRMVRFCGVLTQIWFPTRGNQILLRSENALHLRSAFLTTPVPTRKPKITRLNT